MFVAGHQFGAVVRRLLRLRGGSRSHFRLFGVDPGVGNQFLNGGRCFGNRAVLLRHRALMLSRRRGYFRRRRRDSGDQPAKVVARASC